jgi:copper chaperone CopZ
MRRTLTALLAASFLAAPVLAFACEGDGDAPAAANEPAKPKAGEQVATFTVGGMHCGGCSGHVREALGKIQGVTSVAADFNTGKVTVVFNPKKVTVKALREALAKAGFPEKVA